MDMQSEPEASERQAEFKEKCLTEAGLSYSAGTLLVVVFSLVVAFLSNAFQAAEEDWLVYLSYLFSQIAFAGAAAFYLIRTKESVKAFASPCPPRYFAIALFLQFGLLFSLSYLNGFFIKGLELLGYHSENPPVPDLSGARLIPALFLIALLPALFEEVFFRGILTRNMHRSGWGLAWTCLVSGAMFSLYHGNPEQTVYQFLSGACLALVFVRSGSILPTVSAHFFNNAVILVMSSIGLGDLSAAPFWVELSVIVLSSLCLAGTLVYLLFFDKKGKAKGGVSGRFFAASAGGIAICAIEWIAAFVMGFLRG